VFQEKIVMFGFTLHMALGWLTCLVMPVVGNIETALASKVIVDTATFYEEEIQMLIFDDMSFVQCAAASKMNEEYQTFCLTVNSECMLVNITLVHSYDDGSGGLGDTCYTYKKPLIDRGK